MQIVLDTNILFADIRLRGSAFQTLAYGVRHLPRSRIVIPAVVLEEIAAKYTLKVIEARERSVNALQDLQKLSGVAVHVEPELHAIEPDKDEYQQYILDQLSFGSPVHLAPFPEISHAETVTRAIAKRKPFAESGAGYRDYLIWETILTILSDTKDDVVFLTNNSRDFGDGFGHADLVEDLRVRGLDPDSFRVISSLKDFNERFVIPELHAVAALREEIVQAGYFKQWTLAELPGFIPAPQLAAAVGAPVSGVSVWLDDTVVVSLADLDEVYRLTAEDVVVHGDVDLVGAITTRVTWDQYRLSESVRAYVDEGQVEGATITMQYPITLRIEFETVVNVREQVVADPYIHAAERIERSYRV